jgi:hypothetical protein
MHRAMAELRVLPATQHVRQRPLMCRLEVGYVALIALSPPVML